LEVEVKVEVEVEREVEVDDFKIFPLQYFGKTIPYPYLCRHNIKRGYIKLC